MELHKNFGETVRRLRLDKNMTQEQAAAAFGMAQPRFNRHENAVTEAGLEFIVKACEVFGVTPNQLLGFDSSQVVSFEKAVKTISDHGYKVTIEKALN